MNDILKSLPFSHKLWSVRGVARQYLFGVPRNEPKMEFVADSLTDQERATLEAIFVLNVEDAMTGDVATEWTGKIGKDAVHVYLTSLSDYLQSQPYAGQGVAANIGNDAVLATGESQVFYAGDRVARVPDDKVRESDTSDIAPWLQKTADVSRN